MSEQLLKSAKLEETRLVHDLERTSIYQRLVAVRQIIALYDSGAATLLVQDKAPTQSHNLNRAVRPDSQASTVIAAAFQFLQARKARAQTATIMNALKERGIEFTSANPQGSLSSALSHSELFDNVRGEGYGLVEWVGAQQPTAKPEPQPAESPTETLNPVPAQLYAPTGEFQP